MERNELNSNEKIAMMHNGIEGTGKHFVMNGETADTLIRREQQNKFNDGVDNVMGALDEHNQVITDYMKHISEDIHNLEIMPMFAYALIKPFDTNPFQKVTIDPVTGLVTDTGGLTPDYKSNETGEIEQERQFIKVGTVIEVGYKCEFLKPGDVVFYGLGSENIVPFFKQGFVVVNENRIMAVVNSGLTQRRDSIKNGING